MMLEQLVGHNYLLITYDQCVHLLVQLPPFNILCNFKFKSLQTYVLFFDQFFVAPIQWQVN